MSKDRLGTFADLIPILDAALSCGGGTYELATPGQAVNWRHRCYKFMKAFAEVNGFSKYDALTFPRLAPGSSLVVIKIKQATGTFTPAGPATQPTSAADDLDDAAAKFARSLGIGEEL